MAVVPEGSVVYGMQLPVQAQSTMFVADWERRAGPAEMARIAAKADQAGFHYLGVCDHVAIPRRLAPAMGTVWYDCVATLGFLAGITARVRLLSHVYVPALHHPLAAAKAFATLDALSGGRVIVGVGTGHVPEELAALGADFSRRGALLDEAIDLLATALTDELPEHAGPTWPVSDLAIAPRPVQAPRPPIWVGGSSPAAIRRAALRGDGWLPQGTPRAQMPEQIAVLRRHRQRARPGEAIDVGAICEWIRLGSATPTTVATERPGGLLTGKGEEVASSLRQLVAMGVSQLQVRFAVDSCDELLDQMDAFATEVAPHLSA